MLTLAISKGRICRETLPLLKRIGCAPDEAALDSRSLIVPTANPDVRIIVVRAKDAPTFVAHGAADAGIAGSDILEERSLDDLYQPLDLKLARCRLVVAAKKETTLAGGGRKITIATKYPRLARAYFNPRGIRADFVKLNGTMELAPLVRLADAIVDLAETGDTLRANGLEEKAVIRQVSARLIVNRIAARRNPLVGDLQNRLRAAIDG